MNISKDGKTLYFSDDEIENSTHGEKKVYVTKRINGKESHSKIEKDEDRIFDFSDEIVIGVTPKKPKKEVEKRRNSTNGNKQRSKQKKKEKDKRKRKNNKIEKDDKFERLDNIEKNKKNKKDYKKNKNKKISKKLITIISCILLIVSITIFAFITPIFNISKIEVYGNNKVSSDTVTSLSKLKKGENIFKFNNSIIQNIKENQYIDEVKVKRKLPGTIQIYITEREVKYQVKLINSYAYIDKNGYILEVSSKETDVPIIVGFKTTENELINKNRMETKDLEVLNNILKITDSAKAIDIEKIITEINIENENNYCIFIKGQNKKIYIGDANNLTNKMLYVKKILEEEKDHSGTGYVNGDISNGFKPYFRPE